MLGWIGGLEQYNGNVWELHPLAVRQDKQRQGIGSALVRDFEEQAAKQGVVTVTLGTDDTNGKTTLSGKNLYPDVWIHIKEIQNLRDHPYEFYQKLGYVITGVIPDANGSGKPDILMSKRI
jgi:aminoglycoside 6'-N-acetyltransferase I